MKQFEYSEMRKKNLPMHPHPARSLEHSLDMPVLPRTRRVVPAGGNIDFICWHLFNNPGARYSEVLRALCKFNGVAYARGQYSEYFCSSGHTGMRCAGVLWERAAGGWLLTMDGLARYAKYCCG
jgi:hypothetical protein